MTMTMSTSLPSVTKAGCVVVSALSTSTRKRHNTTQVGKENQLYSLPMFGNGFHPDACKLNTNSSCTNLNGNDSQCQNSSPSNVKSGGSTLLRQRLKSFVHYPRHKKNVSLLLFSLLAIYSLNFLGNIMSQPPPNYHPIPSKGVAHPKNITVVLMNHARPRNIQESSLLPTLLENEHITEVLLLQSNPSLTFEYQHPKVKNINSTLENEKMGLSLRFWFCGRAAKNEWVILVDDDMLVPKSTLEGMIAEFAQNPNRIVGIYGRTLSLWYKTAPVTRGYNTRKIRGPAEVVLTKLMIMERDICPYFHEFSHLVDDLTVTSHPYWNGEDIFMSLVANHVYGHSKKYDKQTRYLAQRGENNFAMPWLPVGEVGDAYTESDGHLDISGNFEIKQIPRPWDTTWRQGLRKAFLHLLYRGELWNEAKERLIHQPVAEIDYSRTSITSKWR